jgi:hypothetical protein
MTDGAGRETRSHRGSRRRTGMIAALLLVVFGSGSLAASNQGINVLLAGYGSPPAITSVIPSSGSSAGGATVTITGSNFSGATAVAFGSKSAISFTVNSASSITAKAPAGAGTVDVSVMGPNGTSAAVVADRFYYQATSLNAIACPPQGGDCLAAGVYSGTQSSVVQVALGKIVTNHSVPAGITLNGIACSATGACTAVGSTAAGVGVLVPVSTAGVTGTPEPVPGTAALFGIACEPTGGCLAVGEKHGTSTKEGVVVPVVSGVAGAPQALPATTRLLAVACPADCIAVGRGLTVAAVVDVKSGTPSAPQDVANAATLQAISCLGATGPCEAVGGTGTRYFSGKAVAVEVVAGQAQFARTLPQASFLTGVVCINEYSCLVTGESSSRGAVLTSTAGGSEALPGMAQADAIACITASTCETVGLDAALNGGIAVPIKRASIGEVNNANVNCEGPSVPHEHERDDAVDDHFQQAVLPTGVRATLTSAPVCRDETSHPLTSSWVMLQSGGAFFQAGIFYNPDGTDDPFVELEYGNSKSPPWYQGEVRNLEKLNDGHIQFNENGPTFGIEIFNYGGVAGGSFAVQNKGETTSATNKQCKWVEEVDTAHKAEYEAIQGVAPGNPRLEVEGRFNGKCLWIGYLPAVYKSTLDQADLSSEVHLQKDEVPGTYAQQLTFQKPEVLTGQTWTSFMPAVTSSDPVLGYQVATGCADFMPTSGSNAAFRTWDINTNGTCLPFRAGP